MTSTVLVFPVLLLVILMAVQFALAFHAKTVVTAAAQDAARTAQAQAGTSAQARTVGEAIVSNNASSLLHDVNVVVRTDGDTVRVEVRGTVTAVIPGMHLHVGGTADGPLERFRPQGRP